MYNNHEVGGAVAAANASSTRRREFRQHLTDYASLVQAHHPALTDGDRQVLKDIQRPGRYEARWLTRLVELGAQCPDESQAFALSRLCDVWVRARRPKRRRLTLREAIRRETTAQANADPFEMDAGLNAQDAGALARAEAALIEHAAAIRELLDAIHDQQAELARVA